MSLSAGISTEQPACMWMLHNLLVMNCLLQEKLEEIIPSPMRKGSQKIGVVVYPDTVTGGSEGEGTRGKHIRFNIHCVKPYGEYWTLENCVEEMAVQGRVCHGVVLASPRANGIKSLFNTKRESDLTWYV